MQVFTLDHHHSSDSSSAELFSLLPHPYVLLYTNEKTELFRVASDGPPLHHVGTLSTTLLKPTITHPVLTSESTLAITKIDLIGDSESKLHIVSLKDACSVRIIPLGGYENLSRLLPNLDGSGRVAMCSITQYPPWMYSILILDTSKDDANLNSITIAVPSDLPSNTDLTVLHYTGDVLVFAALPFCATQFSLVVWQNGTFSGGRLTLPFRQPSADVASITDVISTSPTSFLFATDETDSEALETKHTRGSIIYLVSLVDGALKVDWGSPVLGGYVTDIVPVPSLQLVVIFGIQDQGEGGRESIMVQFIAVLDATTGELKRREDIPETVKSSLGVDKDTLVLVAMGKIMICGIAEFVAQGLPEGEMVDAEVVDTCVVAGGLVMVKNNTVSFAAL
ncbi:hypothetical protein C8R46DRAFT_1347930 [Mycena filopes]|nr:hypothetical protein C8R46DRAFT_1347930 [Mycena filopes]